MCISAESCPFCIIFFLTDSLNIQQYENQFFWNSSNFVFFHNRFFLTVIWKFEKNFLFFSWSYWVFNVKMMENAQINKKLCWISFLVPEHRARAPEVKLSVLGKIIITLWKIIQISQNMYQKTCFEFFYKPTSKNQDFRKKI